MTTTTSRPPNYDSTRATLIEKIKDLDDAWSWQEFFDTYWKVVYSFARRMGLTDQEAEEVVQETMIGVSRQIPDFQYDPSGSFRSWLLNKASWRIKDQLKKRNEFWVSIDAEDPDKRVGKAMVQKSSEAFERYWEAEWKRNLLEVAMDRIGKEIDPKQLQAFDLYVIKGWSAAKVATSLRMSVAQVYLIKHRLTPKLRRAIGDLTSAFEEAIAVIRKGKDG